MLGRASSAKRLKIDVYQNPLQDKIILNYEQLPHPEDYLKLISDQGIWSIKELIKTSRNNQESSKSIAIAKKELKGKISRENFAKVEKELRKIEPLIIILERNAANLRSFKNFYEIKHILEKINFSEDAELDKKFRITFLKFMKAFEKSVYWGVYWGDYLDVGLERTIEPTISKMFDNALKNPNEYIKRVKILFEESSNYIDLSKSEQDLIKSRDAISKKEKNQDKANEVIRSFELLRLFVFTSLYGLAIFILSLSENFIEKNYLINILEEIGEKLKSIYEL